MLHISTLLRHYKRPEIQEAMVRAAENREVAVKYGNKGFGKRPDVLAYPADVLEFAKKGATSFHVSEERWHNVMQISTGMRKKELDDLRRGWDLVLDIDCTIWYYSRYIAHLAVQVLRKYGIKSITAKFSGNKGFHIAVPFEAFPREVKGISAEKLFPDGVRRIALFIAEQIKPDLLAHAKERDGLAELAKQLGVASLHVRKCGSCHKEVKKKEAKVEFVCQYCNKQDFGTEDERYRVCSDCKKIMKRIVIPPASECVYCKSKNIVDKIDIEPLLQIDTVLISSRHLYRMPYSLHEKSGLCSIPIDPDSILTFEREMAEPSKVTVDRDFLTDEDVSSGEATRLILESFDFQPVVEDKNNRVEKAFSKINEEELQEALPEQFFPPCMQKGLSGMEDGKKRFMFVLLNFLSSCGYDYDAIAVMLEEWNKKNPEPLREVLLQGHVRYAKQHKKKVMPPNCDNKGYYKDMGICNPDGLCGRIKNPVQYVKRKAFLANMYENKGQREKLTDEQKEMRRKYREKLKKEKEAVIEK